MVNKHKVENFIIVRPATTAVAPGTTLYNTATGTSNIPVGGFGVFEVDVLTGATGNHVSALVAMTVTNTQYWKIMLRRDTSFDTTPLALRTYQESPIIDASCKVTARGITAAIRNNGLWTIGAVNATAGAVPINNETEYIVNGSLHGWNTQLYNGRNTPTKMGRFTSIDYTSSTFYTIATQQRDHILGNVAFDFNNQSFTQLMAFGIELTGVTVPGANNALRISTIAASAIGTNVIVGFTDEGQAIILTLDADLLQTFTLLQTALAAAGHATANLIPYARPTAANLAVATRLITGGRNAGVADAVVDMLGFVALDMRRAAYNETPQRKERPAIGLDGGFDVSTSSAMTVDAFEGAGYAESVLQWYLDIQSHRMYPGGKRWQPNHVEFHSEIVTGGLYDIYVIESCKNPLATSGMPSVSPQITIIAILNYTVGGSTRLNPGYNYAGLGVGVANPQKAYLEARLNSWMPTTMYPYAPITL